MVRVMLSNESSCKFSVTSRGLSEFESDENFWNLDAEMVAPGACVRICRLDVPEGHKTDSEVYLSIFLWDGEAPSTDDGAGGSALVVRLKVRRELCAPNSLGYEVCSFPCGALMPPSFWNYGKEPVEALWYSRERFYAIQVKRRGFSKLSLEVHDEDPRRHGSPWEGYASFVQRIDRPAPPAPAQERAVAATAEGIHQQPAPPLEEQEEIYENEHKNHRLGHARYSKQALGMFDRPAWTDYHGRRKPPMELVFLPSPCWRWTSEWQVDIQKGITDEEGWMYATGWHGEWKAEKSFGRMVRRRRWIRTRAPATTMPFEERAGAIRHQIIPAATLVRFREQLQASARTDAVLVSDLLDRKAAGEVSQAQRQLIFLSFKLALLESLSDRSARVEYLRQLGRQHSPRLLRQAMTVAA